MKNLLRTAVLCAFLLSLSCTYAQFRPIYQDGDSINHIQGLSFYTPSEGYVAFRFFAGYTTDSGRTFVQRPVTPANMDIGGNTINYTFGFDPFGIKAFNKDTLLYYGDFGLEPTILYSVNGGQNWKVVYHEPMHVGSTTGAIVYDVQFPRNTATGFAVQDNGVLKTTDRGRTWRPVLTREDARLSDMSFTSEVTGYVIGENKLLKTADGGISWSALNTPAYPEHVEFVSDQVGFVVTREGTVYKTTNGGTSWTAMNSSINPLRANHVVFLSETTGYAAGYPYGVQKTTNGGRNWELLKGSNVFSGRTGDGFNELFFYNNSLAWVGGDRGYLMKTDNGGGTTYPQALWTYSNAEMCTTGRMLLQNYSVSGYSFAWYRNDSLMATTYNASYPLGTGPDVITLVVSNGTDRDTLTRTIYASAVQPPTIHAAARDSTVCTYQQAWVDVFNSDPSTQYRICQVGDIYCSVEQKGNGGTLSLPAYINSDVDSTITYHVTASRYTDCGYKTADTTLRFHFRRLNIPVTVVSDTVCLQHISSVLITNSRPDYRYWIDSTHSAMGNGGTITVNFDPRGYDYPLSKPLFNTMTQRVYVEYVPFGCSSPYISTPVYMTVRNTKAGFEMLGNEYFTGDSLRFRNTSQQAVRYKWFFTDGSSADSVKQVHPEGVSYSTTGQKLVMLYSYTREGCVDSASRTIEIFAKRAVPHGTAGQLVYSQEAKALFRLRDIHEDEYGNLYLAGGINQVDYSGRTGLFASKLDANRNVVWQLTQKSLNWSEPWSTRHHLVVEQVVSDAYGYSYLYGHTLYNRSIKDSTNEFLLPNAGSFLAKVNPRGKIVWVKSFYNKRSTYVNFSSGSLLKGKNNDLYIVTQQEKSGGEFWMNDEAISTGSSRTGLILHLDEYGRLLDQSTYPARYANLWDFYSSNDDWDHLPKAVYDEQGRIAFYTELNPAEISGGKIDEATLSFDVRKVQTALLYFDTAQKKIVDVKPLHRLDTTGSTVSAPALCFALDRDGSYYAGSWETINVLPSTQYYPYDTRYTTKPRSAVRKFASDGTVVWTKMLEGLQPNSLELNGSALMVLGDNFPTEPTNFFTTNYPNVSGRYSEVKKVTAIHDPNSYNADGATGNGSVDMVLAQLHSSTGAAQTLDTYGNERAQNAFVLKKGYGNELYFASQGNLRGDNLPYVADTAATLYLYQAQGAAGGTTAYKSLPRFVKFDHYSLYRLCIDSLVQLNWSQNAVTGVKLSYSTDAGASYRPLAANLSAASLTYSFRPDSTMRGRVLFRIEDGEQPALSDTLSFEIAYKPVTPVIRAEPAALICGDVPVTLSVDSSRCPTCVYSWSTGATGASITVSQMATYTVRATNSCGTLTASQWVSTYGAWPLTLSASSATVCQGGSVTLTAGGGQNYKWTGPGLRDTTGAMVVAAPTAVGKATYTVRMESSGCVQTKTVDVTVSQSPAPSVQIAYSGCPGPQLTFQPSTVTNSGTAPLYTWYINERNMGTSNTLMMDTLKNGATVYCVMTSNAACAYPKTVKSNVVTISCLTTGVVQVDGVESFVVAPNPSNGKFTVRVKTWQAKKVSFRVLDNTGRPLYRSAPLQVRGALDHTIDLSHLAGGTYYLETTLSGKVVTEKIIIYR